MQRFYPLFFAFLWSTGFIGAKYGLPYAEPLTFLCSRYVLVIGLMGLVALATRGDHRLILPARLVAAGCFPGRFHSG